jgi:hypothetical protein
MSGRAIFRISVRSRFRALRVDAAQPTKSTSLGDSRRQVGAGMASAHSRIPDGHIDSHPVTQGRPQRHHASPSRPHALTSSDEPARHITVISAGSTLDRTVEGSMMNPGGACTGGPSPRPALCLWTGSRGARSVGRAVCRAGGTRIGPRLRSPTATSIVRAVRGTADSWRACCLAEDSWREMPRSSTLVAHASHSRESVQPEKHRQGGVRAVVLLGCEQEHAAVGTVESSSVDGCTCGRRTYFAGSMGFVHRCGRTEGGTE